MRALSVTVGLPVRNLAAAVGFYQAAFELGDPDLVPMDGLVEFDLGPFWLQLAEVPIRAGARGITVTISVESVADEQRRLSALGYTVSDIERIEGVVEYFELEDDDGNKIGFVTEL